MYKENIHEETQVHTSNALQEETILIAQLIVYTAADFAELHIYQRYNARIGIRTN